MKAIAVPVDFLNQVIMRLNDMAKGYVAAAGVTRSNISALADQARLYAAAPPQPERASLRSTNAADNDQPRFDPREAIAYAREMGLPTEFPEPTDHLAAPDSRERAFIPEHMRFSHKLTPYAEQVKVAATQDLPNTASILSSAGKVASVIGESGPASATAPITSSTTVSACSRCGKIGAKMDDGHTCITVGNFGVDSSATSAGQPRDKDMFTEIALSLQNSNEYHAATSKFPRPSGDCITDRMRQRRAESKQAESPVPAAPASTLPLLGTYAWAQGVVDAEGYAGWMVIGCSSGGGLCLHESKRILVDELHDQNPFMFLHEIAHIRHVGHDAHWADYFTRLCLQYVGPVINERDAQAALAQVQLDKAEFDAFKVKLALAKEAIRATAGLQRIAETERDQYKDKLAKYERAKMPPEPERLTMTRKLAAGGVATETVVAAHHYDALRIRLARYEAAERELPETDFHWWAASGMVPQGADDPEHWQRWVTKEDYDALRTFAAAQTVSLATARASERERCAKVADQYPLSAIDGRNMAQAIRALKDAP